MVRPEQRNAEDRALRVDVLGDSPLCDPSDGADALGYAPFAKDLAMALATGSPKDGLVVALYGSWGAGKSTMLNFVERELEKAPNPPAVVRFNPWWFSGQEALVQFFFSELTRGLDLSPVLNDSKDALQQAAPLLRILGKALSTFGGGALTQLVDEISKEQPLSKTRSELEGALKKLGKEILVIVDDIDRLAPDEIKQMFRLVKAVANFPNVTYLLAFDKRVVGEVCGEEYLAKIIQIAFEMPLPDRHSLRNMLQRRLEKLLPKASQQLEGREWDAAYEDDFRNVDGIRHFMRTPRDVVRLTNFLSLTYPSNEDINAVDFITIETLRVNCPTVYDLIRKNPERFCFDFPQSAQVSRRRGPPGSGVRDLRPTPFEVEKLREFHEPAFQTLIKNEDIAEEDIVPIKRLITQMFPKLVEVLALPDRPAFNPALDAPPELRPRRNGVCYTDMFPIYFRLSPPEGEVSRAELLLLCTNVDALAKKLDEFRSELNHARKQKQSGRSSRAQEVLARLRENIHAVPHDKAAPMFRVTFERAELIEELDPRGVWVALLLGLLGQLQQETSRIELLEGVVADAKSLESSVRLVQALEQSSSRTYNPRIDDPLPPPLVSETALSKLQELAARKIEKASEKKASEKAELLDSPRLRLLLGSWWAWGDKEALKRWGAKVIGTPKDFARLLERFVERGRVPPGGEALPVPTLPEPEPVIRDRLDPRWLGFFAEPHELEGLATHLLAEALTDGQRSAAKTLIRECKEWRSRREQENPFDLP
jgi:predicted KAP-like P-loop ATPase